MKLVKANDPVLTREAEKVIFPHSSIKKIASDMMLTMLANRGCGLAAPQVGLPLRMFVWTEDGDSGVVINPVIVPNGPEIEFREGCLTYPGKQYRTRRSSSIWCNSFDLDGKPSGLQKIDGFRAIVFQHEFDHLVGRLLPHHGIVLEV